MTYPIHIPNKKTNDRLTKVLSNLKKKINLPYWKIVLDLCEQELNKIISKEQDEITKRKTKKEKP